MFTEQLLDYLQVCEKTDDTICISQITPNSPNH